MPKKRRIIERLDEDEALVVAPVDFWKHVIGLYRMLGEEYPGIKEWDEAATHIELWVHATEYNPDSEEY